MTIGERRGFTLVNLLVAIAVMSLLAGVAAVSMAPDDRARVLGAAEVLASDIEHAQALSLASPDDPVVVRFDAENEGYWLERVSAPDEAMAHSNGSPYVVIFGQGDAATMRNVDLTIESGADEGWLEYDAFGRLTTLQDVVIRLTLGDEDVWLVTSSSTGFVDIELVNPVAEPAGTPKDEGGGALSGPLGGLLGR